MSTFTSRKPAFAVHIRYLKLKYNIFNIFFVIFKLSVFKIDKIVILWVYYTLPFSLYRHYWSIAFQSLLYLILLRIKDENLILEMRTSPKVLIQSNFKNFVSFVYSSSIFTCYISCYEKKNNSNFKTELAIVKFYDYKQGCEIYKMRKMVKKCDLIEIRTENKKLNMKYLSSTHFKHLFRRLNDLGLKEQWRNSLQV